MKPKINKIKLSAFCLALGLASALNAAKAQSTTLEQIQALVPNEQDLQGFARVRPAGEEILDERFSQETHTWVQPVSKAAVVEDHIQIAAQKPDNAPFWEEGKTCSRIIRKLYSENGLYALTINITVYDTPASAKEDLGHLVKDLSIRMEAGSLTGPQQIGDESWSDPRNEPHGNNNFQTLWFRQGKTLVFIQGSSTRRAARSLIFPAAAVDAVAYQVLLHASQQPELTGISVQQAKMSVNRHILPENALKVAGQTYVPVKEFAKAMGLTTQWNTKTGALTLSGAGRKTVILTADSTAARIGAKAAALTVPVLKQAGQPVMTLTDLLKVTGGHITARNSNSVQVRG